MSMFIFAMLVGLPSMLALAAGMHYGFARGRILFERDPFEQDSSLKRRFVPRPQQGPPFLLAILLCVALPLCLYQLVIRVVYIADPLISGMAWDAVNCRWKVSYPVPLAAPGAQEVEIQTNHPGPGLVEIECDECHGKGQVSGQLCIYCQNGILTLSDGRTCKCPVCLGTGTRIGSCPLCEGTGKLYTKPRKKR